MQACIHSPTGGPGGAQPLPEHAFCRAEGGLQQVDGIGGEERRDDLSCQSGLGAVG